MRLSPGQQAEEGRIKSIQSEETIIVLTKCGPPSLTVWTEENGSEARK